MSTYWNKISLNKLLGSECKTRPIKYKINTEIGRFYFYFEKEDDTNVSGKLVFFPKIDAE